MIPYISQWLTAIQHCWTNRWISHSQPSCFQFKILYTGLLLTHNYVLGEHRFKGLDLIRSAWGNMDRGSWHCSGDRDQDHLHGKEMQKSKMAVWEGLTNSCEKKRDVASEIERHEERFFKKEIVISCAKYWQYWWDGWVKWALRIDQWI